MTKYSYASMAEWLMRPSLKRVEVGSNPARSTKIMKGNAMEKLSA